MRLLILCLLLLLINPLQAEVLPPANELAVTKSEVQEWEKQSEAGDPLAHYWMGKAYFKGWHVNQDLKTALDLFRRAADAEVPEGLNALGYCYLYGVGVEADQEKGLGILRPLAEGGFAWAQHNMSVAYHNGVGVEEDHEEAVRWARLAAEQNDPHAIMNLALAYHNGEGVEQNDAKALELAKKSAELKNPKALRFVAWATETGLVEEADAEAALPLYREAAELNDVEAMLDISHRLFQKADQNEEALSWLNKAAQMDSAEAQFRLGGMYLYAIRVEKDLDKAISWLERAVSNGHEEAGGYLKAAREEATSDKSDPPAEETP